MNKKSTTGVICIITNPSFPKQVKIDYTFNVEERLKKLNRNNIVPSTFSVYAEYQVNGELTEKKLHKLLGKLNPELCNKRREHNFYAMTVEEAYSLLESIAMISGTLDRLQRLTPGAQAMQDEQAVHEEEAPTRRGNFRFSAVGIPVGSELTFIEDPSIKVVVVDDWKVEYNGKRTSMSALSQSLKRLDHPVQGPLYFSYKGERLTDLRARLERLDKTKDI